MLDPFVESILIFSGINVVLALSLYLPVSAGLLSLGQGGFFAIQIQAKSGIDHRWDGRYIQLIADSQKGINYATANIPTNWGNEVRADFTFNEWNNLAWSRGGLVGGCDQ